MLISANSGVDISGIVKALGFKSSTRNTCLYTRPKRFEKLKSVGSVMLNDLFGYYFYIKSFNEKMKNKLGRISF